MGLKRDKIPSPQTTGSRSISIPLDDLQSFKKWSAPAKKYLRTIHEKVDVLEVATVYRDKVIAFHNWFRSRQEEIHANELKELDVKKDELRALMGDSYIPPAEYYYLLAKPAI
jgi:hypothetical protein